MINMRWTVLAALVLAAGCGSKASDSAAGGDNSSCSGAIDSGMAAMVDARKKALDERMGSQTGGPDRAAKILERSQQVIDKLKVALTARCSEDHWTAETLACFSKVTRREEVQACIAKLPKDQADKTNAEVMKAMTAGMGGMRMRPPGAGGEMPHVLAPGAPGTGPIAPLPGATPVQPTPTPPPALPPAPAPAPAK